MLTRRDLFRRALGAVFSVAAAVYIPGTLKVWKPLGTIRFRDKLVLLCTKTDRGNLELPADWFSWKVT